MLMLIAVTNVQRIDAAKTLLLGVFLIIAIGILLLRLIGGSSPGRRLHGKYVLVWMLISWVVGGFLAEFMMDQFGDLPGEGPEGPAAFTMPLGWVIGMVHGAFALRQ